MADATAKKEHLLAQAAASEARVRALECSAAERVAAEARRKEAATKAAYDRWLQCDYPNEVAERIVAWRKTLSAVQLQRLTVKIEQLRTCGENEVRQKLPHLWNKDRKWCRQVGFVSSMGGRVACRCPGDFEYMLFRDMKATGKAADVGELFLRLMDNMVPKGRTLFNCGRYTTLDLANFNDGAMHGAFLHAVFLLSKWLGKKAFPEGVHKWPPPAPTAAEA